MAEYGIVLNGDLSVDKLGRWLLGVVVLYNIGYSDGSRRNAKPVRLKYVFGDYLRHKNG